MAEPLDVVVAVPARDEEARIDACLSSVLAAVRVARSAGVIADASVAVAAHCCHDHTARRARRTLNAAPDVDGEVWESSDPAPVGAVRSELIRRTSAGSTRRPDRTWLFSTDADTTVPASWITTGLRLAAESGSVMVVGLVDLDEREASLPVWLAHDRLIRAGLFPDGSHDHVYAANLAIRFDAYLESGGFPAVVAGEERALLNRARAVGCSVLTTTHWRARTSARTLSRARGGLGDLLGRLALDADRSRDGLAG